MVTYAAPSSALNLYCLSRLHLLRMVLEKMSHATPLGKVWHGDHSLFQN